MKTARWLAPLVAPLVAALACGREPVARAPVPVVPGPLSSEAKAELWGEVRQLLETRCVVCHGCYDAPCQLKLGSFDGIARGASTRVVYDGSRLLAAEPTRLGIDARDLAGWRKKDFHPVLPEGATDPKQSPLLRMLELKRLHPLPEGGDSSKLLTLDLNREQTCSSAEKFDDYAAQHPLWGMPYGLPGLPAEAERKLAAWVEAGAPHLAPPEPKPQIVTQIQAWETFLNDDSLQGQLAARYLYEHLFLASLRFEGDEQQLFRLVRSRTPSGQPLDEIPTRRPFGDPKTRPYYRFVLRDERPLDKTYMPYGLSPARLARYRGWFLDPKYEVKALPGYDSEEASNPFAVFDAIPEQARYRFLLEEAQFTMMGFIKGPVCRGQVALNVIRDRFWVTFLSPDSDWTRAESHFLAGEKDNLALPAKGGSNALPTEWLGFSSKHARYMKARWEFFARQTQGGKLVQPDLIWDGDGNNPNAALTVFRHFDSATVVKGLVGGPPKTAWVVSYPILERIHYLLVAGFDVFGSVGHQLSTRLYMDFLRMESEALFLQLLPPSRRPQLIDYWYRGVTGDSKKVVDRTLQGVDQAPAIRYQSGEPEQELYRLLETRLARVRARDYDLERATPGDLAALRELDAVWGESVSALPETSFVTVTPPSGEPSHYSLLRDSAHTNVAHLFQEDERRVRAEDELTVVPGFLGAYPNALFSLKQGELPGFVQAVRQLKSAADYAALRQRYGVLRTSPRFWEHSDALQRARERGRGQDGEGIGLLDYNRLGGW